MKFSEVKVGEFFRWQGGLWKKVASVGLFNAVGQKDGVVGLPGFKASCCGLDTEVELVEPHSEVQ